MLQREGWVNPEGEATPRDDEFDKLRRSLVVLTACYFPHGTRVLAALVS